MNPIQLLAKKLYRTAQALAWKEWNKDAVVTLGDVLKSRNVLPDPGSPRYDSLQFTNKAIEKMKQWNLSETDVADVFFHGEVIKEHLMSRKYNGYEIGIYYFKDKRTGLPIITSIWKRERR